MTQLLRIQVKLTAFLLSGVLISSCVYLETDTEKPMVDFSAPGTFPGQCDTIYFGETFQLNLVFSDNVELGSFSINIHHNFDHHSHSTEVIECDLSPKKDPVNPFQYTNGFTIPPGIQTYTANDVIEIPVSNENGTFDEGDYHFFISLTDHEGWSAQRGLSIKMLYR